MNSRLLATLLVCLAPSCTGPREETPAIPDIFLQTTDPGWQRILGTEVSEDFHEAPLSDALVFISRRSGANLITRFDNGEPPPVTRKFERVPFRTALYLLARDSGATVTWAMTPEGSHQGIIFTVSK